MALKTLKIDDKWSVQYDPKNNDSPVYLWRYDDLSEECKNWKNPTVAMFYAILEARGEK